jgi:hypothetical protein
MAVFLIGLIGYPLMYPTLSAEGDQSDTLDALNRSINYVASSPWYYIWYWIVTVLYGAAVTFFVLFFISLTVYAGKWAVSLTASAAESAFGFDRKPDYLFIYAPESFGWRELLTRDSPYEVRGQVVMTDREGKETTDGNKAVSRRYVYKPVNEVVYKQARSEFWAYNNWGAALVGLWLTLLFLIMLGFSYSFFWCAATMIYLLMRRRVDEAELDEVYLEDEEPEAPLAPPKLAEGTTSAALPVIEPPAPPAAPPAPPAPPVLPPPPPPTEPRAADTIPFSPPPPPPPESLNKDEGPLG